MSYPDPSNPYAQPPQGQPYAQPQGQPYGYPQQPPAQPGYGYPQQPYAPYPPQQPAYGGGYSQPGAMPAFAGWWSRVGATIVDGLIIFVPYMVLAGIGAVMASNASPGEDAGTGAALVFSILGFLTLVGITVWQLVQEGRTGQTIGKKALGIRLLREADGRPLGVGMAFVRRLAHFVDGLPLYLGYLWPIWDAKKQTFADKIVSSVVVKSR